MVSFNLHLACVSAFILGSWVSCSHTKPQLLKRQDNSDLPSELNRFPENTNSLTIWQALVQNPSFSDFTTLVRVHSPSIVEVLDSTPPDDNKWTLFAPYNPAFETVVDKPVFDFANNTDQFDNLWTQAFAYHVIQQPIQASDIPQPPEMANVTSLNGLDVTAQRAPERPSLFLAMVNVKQEQESPLNVYINDAQVILPDVAASNGIIHVVDRLVSPLFLVPSFPTTSIPFPTSFPTTLPSLPTSLPNLPNAGA